MTRKRGRPPGSEREYYTIYDDRTDQILAFGTAREISDKLGISRKTVYSRIHKALTGKVRRWAVVKEGLSTTGHRSHRDT